MRSCRTSRSPRPQLPFIDINALFFAEGRGLSDPGTGRPDRARGDSTDNLRVAIVGSGPAALYAADELLKQPGVAVTVIDRLPTPHGLVRAGVAPDHESTKSIDGLFRKIEDQPGFHYLLNVEIGTDLSHEELLAHHHAVLYATGASQDRALDIPGMDLPGSETATAFVAWYNGHPDHADRTFDLSGERAVIVGNGNVALDVARILTADPARLATTDIADHALEALRGSAVREVVLLGRRGAAQAAFTLPELVGLLSHEDIDFVVEGADLDEPVSDPMVARKLAALREAVARPRRRALVGSCSGSARHLPSCSATTGSPAYACRRNVLVRRMASPYVPKPPMTSRTSRRGWSSGRSATTARPCRECRSTMPAGVIPNEGGRVTATPARTSSAGSSAVPAGSSAPTSPAREETVAHLIADFNAGRLEAGRTSRQFAQLVSEARTARDRRTRLASDRQGGAPGRSAAGSQPAEADSPRPAARAAAAARPARRPLLGLARR